MNTDAIVVGLNMDTRTERRWRRKTGESFGSSHRSKGLKKAGKVEGSSIAEGRAVSELDPDYVGYLKSNGLSLCSSKQCDSLNKDDGVVGLGEDDMDQEYVTFLGNIRKDRNFSFLFEGPSKDGVSRVFRIEEEGDEDLFNYVNEAPLEDCMQGKNGSNERDLGNALQKIEKGKARAELLSSRQRSKPLAEIRCSRVRHSSSHKGNCGMVSDTDIDENYCKFLRGTKIDGENLVVRLKSGKEITLFEDGESSSDSEVVVVVDPFSGGRYTPFVPSKEYLNLPGQKDWEDIQTPFRSPFREKLMDLLKKPFSQSEYDDLLKDISRKKPIEGHKELREGREMKVIVNSAGKSYLDDFKDLHQMLSEKRDRNKRLSLLRGFFYWVQNRPQDDSFMPWLDSSFLEAL